jgi:hypothetical protein
MGITYQTTNRLRRKVMTAPLGQLPQVSRTPGVEERRPSRTGVWLSVAALGLVVVSVYAWLAH